MPISSTIVAALQYDGGVVIGADSQTSDPIGKVRWQSRKLEQIANRPLVVGFSGQVAVLRKMQAAIDQRFASSHQTTFAKQDRVIRLIHDSLQPVYEEQSKKHPDASFNSIWRLTVVGLAACWAEGKPHILEIEHNGEIDIHAHFRAIGSGAGSAYAVWKAFGAERLNQYSEGIALQVMWRILKVCIDTEIYGVSEPVIMWAVTENKARQIQGAELDTLREVEDQDFLFTLSNI